MSRSTFYAQQTLNLHNKYGLSQNAKILLKALDDHKFGRIDQKELGRIVRLSNSMRKAITDTITKCARIMGTKEGEVKHCVEIIQSCTEILAIADQPPPMEEFPLLKLPTEVRQNIYKQYLRMATRKKDRILVGHRKKSTCSCAGHEPSHFPFQALKLALAQASRQVRDEFLPYFYAKNTFYFPCACDMLENLKANKMLQHHIRAVKVHWNGPVSDTAFTALGKCPRLEELYLIISKATTNNLTPRETEMLSFFTAQKPARISDSLGLDELIQIRGLNTVVVGHILLRQGSRRSDEDRANLQALLRGKLTLPKDDKTDWDYDDTSLVIT